MSNFCFSVNKKVNKWCSFVPQLIIIKWIFPVFTMCMGFVDIKTWMMAHLKWKTKYVTQRCKEAAKLSEVRSTLQTSPWLWLLSWLEPSVAQCQIRAQCVTQKRRHFYFLVDSRDDRHRWKVLTLNYSPVFKLCF